MKKVLLFLVLLILGQVFINQFLPGFIRNIKRFGRDVLTYQKKDHPDPNPISIKSLIGIHSPDSIKESYTYRESSGGVIVTAKMGNDQFSTKNGVGYLLVTLEGDDLPVINEYKRKPLNLSIVIDRSGSMSGEKLTAVKNALRGITQYISPGDKVSLVVYDDDVQTLIYPQQFDEELFLSEVSRIQSGGSTNLEGGLRKGLDHVAEYNSSEYLNRVILLSDGLANVGIENAEGLASIVKLSKFSDISVSTIGVGADYDEKLMTSVASAGRGNYYFMEDSRNVSEIFAQEFNNLTQTVAEDVEVKFNLDKRFEITRGIGYDHRGGNSFQPYDVQAGRKLTYLFEIKAKNSNDLNSNSIFSLDKLTLMNLEVKFRSQKTLRNEQIEFPIYIETVYEEINPLADNSVYEEFMRSYMAEELGNIYINFDNHKNEMARDTLDEVYQNVVKANLRLEGIFDSELKEVEEKQEFAADLEDKDVKSSKKGKLFQKSVQFESYSRVYNK